MLILAYAYPWPAVQFLSSQMTHWNKRPAIYFGYFPARCDFPPQGISHLIVGDILRNSPGEKSHSGDSHQYSPDWAPENPLLI